MFGDVWVPDSEAGTCMHCKKVFVIPSFFLLNLKSFQVQYTLVNRRHHCSKCGVVCCNACSSKRWKWKSVAWLNLSLSRFLLPAQSSKPLRVCMTCYDELSSQSADHSFNKGMFAVLSVFRKGLSLKFNLLDDGAARYQGLAFWLKKWLCPFAHSPLNSPESS